MADRSTSTPWASRYGIEEDPNAPGQASVRPSVAPTNSWPIAAPAPAPLGSSQRQLPTQPMAPAPAQAPAVAPRFNTIDRRFPSAPSAPVPMATPTISAAGHDRTAVPNVASPTAVATQQQMDMLARKQAMPQNSFKRRPYEEA